MLSFTLVAHWLACIWYVIAQEEVETDLGKKPLLSDTLHVKTNSENYLVCGEQAQNFD